MRFVLIHGGFHGAWCWSSLIPELERIGQEVLAIDLPGHGERRAERSTLADRRDAIIAVLKSGDVLVGHSGGGFDISLAADAAPDRIHHLIYLAAGLPLEGRPLLDATGGASRYTEGARQVSQLNESIPNSALKVNAQGRLEWVDFQAARELFYHDCAPDIAAWAFAQLSPAPPEILVDPVSIPSFWSAELPRSYIICLQDRALPFGTAMNFAGRLGVVPHFIDSSHSPFLSHPAELAELLVRATTTTPVATLRP